MAQKYLRLICTKILEINMPKNTSDTLCTTIRLVNDRLIKYSFFCKSCYYSKFHLLQDVRVLTYPASWQRLAWETRVSTNSFASIFSKSGRLTFYLIMCMTWWRHISQHTLKFASSVCIYLIKWRHTLNFMHDFDNAGLWFVEAFVSHADFAN